MEPEVVKVVTEIKDLQVHNGHYYIVLVASIISFAITYIVKPFVKKKFTDKEMASSVTRAFAVVTGAIVGYSLEFQIIDLWLGAAAGGVNAFIVKMLKKKANAHLGVSESAESKEGSKDDSKG
jgi:hypothetical protein